MLEIALLVVLLPVSCVSAQFYWAGSLSVLEAGRGEGGEKEGRGCCGVAQPCRAASGLLVLGLVSLAWMGATQFLKATYRPGPGGNSSQASSCEVRAQSKT